MKFKTAFHKPNQWRAHGQISELVTPKLADRTCPSFLPDDVKQALDDIVVENYERGFMDCLEQIRRELLLREDEDGNPL